MLTFSLIECSLQGRFKGTFNQEVLIESQKFLFAVFTLPAAANGRGGRPFAYPLRFLHGNLRFLGVHR